MGQAPSSVPELAKEGPWSAEDLARLVGRLEADIQSARTMCLSVHLPSVGRSVIGVPERHDIASTGALTALVRQLRRTCAVPVDLLLEHRADRVAEMQTRERARATNPSKSELILLRREFERKEECDNVRLLLSDTRGFFLDGNIIDQQDTTYSVGMLQNFMMATFLDETRTLCDLLECQARRGPPAPVLRALQRTIAEIARFAANDMQLAVFDKVENGEKITPQELHACAVRFNDCRANITDCFTVAQLYRTDKPWRPVAICYGGSAHTVFTLALLHHIESRGGIHATSVAIDEVWHLAKDVTRAFHTLEVTTPVAKIGISHRMVRLDSLLRRWNAFRAFAGKHARLLRPQHENTVIQKLRRAVAAASGQLVDATANVRRVGALREAAPSPAADAALARVTAVRATAADVMDAVDVVVGAVLGASS